MHKHYTPLASTNLPVTGSYGPAAQVCLQRTAPMNFPCTRLEKLISGDSRNAPANLNMVEVVETGAVAQLGAMEES
jgi:hypothetical protein